jgi:hypothetical protein
MLMLSMVVVSLNNLSFSSVTDMARMSAKILFNGDTSGWNVSSVTNISLMFDDCPISEEHKPTFTNGR